MKTSSRKSIAAALLALLLLVSLPVSTAFAGSDLRNAGAGADLADVGTIAWTNPGNITIADTNYATAAITPLGTSHYLTATNFGFSIPVDAPIVGIQATIKRRASSTVSLQDNFVKIIKGGVLGGDDKSSAAEWENVFVSATYGNASDLWGVAWSPADINGADFGVALSVSNNNSSLNRTASVDLVQISVTYGVPTTTGVNCTGPAVYGTGTSCTVTVTRTVGLHTPGGSVAWSTDGGGTFSGGGVCSLSGSGASGACSVTYTPSSVGDGSHLITAVYAGDDNFLGSTGNQGLTVNPRPIEATADAKNKTYGDSDPALTYQLTSGTFVDGDGFSGALSRAAGEDAGTHAILQGTLTAGADYDLTFVGANLTINQRPIEVTAGTDTKEYDGTTDSAGVPTLTSGSLAFSDTATWTQTFDTKDVGTGKTLTPAGSVSDGNGGNNYDVTFVTDTTGEITARPITVTADDQSKALGDSDPPLTYQVTSGSLAAGDAFTGALTRVAGEDVGTYAIQQGTLDAGANYNMTFVPGTFTIFEVNLPPTNISLFPSSVRENRPAGTTVGTLTTTDPNAGDTFTYAFCSGSSTVFSLSGDLLKTAVKLDFEKKASYSVCIRTDDGHGGTFQKSLTVTVLNLPETFTSAASYDGWILESAEASNLGGTKDSTATFFNVGDYLLNKQYRSILSFNTAGIPDNAVITKVTLMIRRLGTVGTNPFTTHQKLLLDVRTGAFSGAAALELTDFNAAATLNGAGLVNPTPLANNWFKGSLYSTGLTKINKTGITQLRLRFQLDDNNDGGADFVKFYSGNALTVSDRPVLLIEYTVP